MVEKEMWLRQDFAKISCPLHGDYTSRTDIQVGFIQGRKASDCNTFLSISDYSDVDQSSTAFQGFLNMIKSKFKRLLRQRARKYCHKKASEVGNLRSCPR